MATASYYITHRRMEHTPGHASVHVGWVMLSDGSTMTRQQVLNYMRQGFTFNTYVPKTGHQARVLPRQCARCNTTYLTTSPDPWKDDNLDHLPTF